MECYRAAEKGERVKAVLNDKSKVKNSMHGLVSDFKKEETSESSVYKCKRQSTTHTYAL